MEIQVEAGVHEAGIPCVMLTLTDESSQFRVALDTCIARDIAAGLTQMSINAEIECERNNGKN